MDSSMSILGVLITAFGGIAVALIQRGRKENGRDHNAVIERLDKIDGKLDGHLRWHKTKKK